MKAPALNEKSCPDGSRSQWSGPSSSTCPDWVTWVEPEATWAVNSQASPALSTKAVGRTCTASAWLPIGAGPLLWSQYRLNTGWATSVPQPPSVPPEATVRRRGQA